MFKKILKVLCLVFGLILLGSGAIYLAAHNNFKKTAEKKFPEPDLALQVELNPHWKNEGKRLTQMKGCLDCHGPQLEGRTFIEDPAIGVFSGSNLTPHATGVSETYSTKDWVRAIRFGLNRGNRLLKFMPSQEFSSLSDEDLGKIIVYLQSLPPVAKNSRPITVGPMAKVLDYFGKMPLLFSGKYVPNERIKVKSLTAEDTIEYGKYVSSSCVGCHNPQFTGGPIDGVPPSWPHASNITSKGKLQAYDFDDFKKVLTTGVTKDGRKINPQFMPWTATAAMSETELKALYRYLKSI
ncbi:c-type cytochrome [Peredibacter starrii]|uniref:C-type cytochrome n=1 Tax=Peredibacter starrii TaxID=28202 RepID=A0AAX4HPC5_9BACT|nr:c-type cytochrome [Peredibacter starrii]WPU65042.1 c-type cytochrome [Peredibacter starrii]